MAEAGRNYSVPVEKGMLIVAYPNENVDDTEFVFSYRVETMALPKGIDRTIIAIIIALIVVAGVIICLTVRHVTNKNKVEVLNTLTPGVPQLQLAESKADETNEHHTIEVETGGHTKPSDPLTTDAEKGDARYSQLPEDPENTAAKGV